MKTIRTTKPATSNNARSDLLHRLCLLPYQSAFAANDSRFKIGLWARQTGKDHTATAEAVIDCLQHPGTDWVILAASERQALESLAKAKDWADILKFRIDEYIESPANLPLAVARAASTEIKWSNGSRLIALPKNPQTIRGYSANLILTEFAFHEDSDAIWSAIYPSIGSPFGGIKKLRIISTPNGLTNKFADLWLNAPEKSYTEGGQEEHGGRRDADAENRFVSLVTSPATIGGNAPALLPVNSAAYFKSKITIHDAIAAGLPLDAAELAAGLNDPEAWSQEYLCEFMDSSTVMFPYDLIGPCESEQAHETNPQLSTLNPQPMLYAGIDFGRKHHLTVCWILERVPAPPNFLSPQPATRSPHLFITREVITLKNTSTPDQLEILRPRLQRCRRICLDYTGAGVGLGDYLHREFNPHSAIGDPQYHRLELCPFTTAFKAELFPRLRAAFEQRLLRIPISREIREDLHAIQRTVTQSGQISYRAPHSADGHSDRTTALALALRAGSSAPVSACARSIWVPGRTADLRWSRRAPRLAGRRILL